MENRTFIWGLILFFLFGFMMYEDFNQLSTGLWHWYDFPSVLINALLTAVGFNNIYKVTA
jgi:hypothetical protein